MPHYRLAIRAFFAGGTASTLLLSLAQGLLNPGSTPLVPPELDCICPSFSLSALDQGGLEIFLCGLLIGLLAGPILDVAWIIRDRRRRFVIGALWGHRSGRPYHRVLHE